MVDRLRSKYFIAIKNTLNAAICLTNFSSELIDGRSQPEIESNLTKNVILNPVTICGNNQEKVYIETSINSVRISTCFRNQNELASLVLKEIIPFLQNRAENFLILRRKPIQGYDISFLILNNHSETFFKHKLVQFIIDFLADLDSLVAKIQVETNQMSRICAQEYLKRFSEIF